MPTPHDSDVDDLVPIEPHDVGVNDRDPDAAHTEAAHLLADEAHGVLSARGFTDSEIRHWTDAYIRQEGSGDVDGFLAWIAEQEHLSEAEEE